MMKLEKYTVRWAGVLFCLLFTATAIQAVPLYRVTVLEDLPGLNTSRAWAINNNGQVVGYSTHYETQAAEAFYWDEQNGMQSLTPNGSVTHTNAWGINDAGQVVGRSGNTAFFWEADTGMRTLEEITGEQWSQAFDINNLGQITGILDNAAVLWDKDEGLINLSNFSSEALFPRAGLAVNDHGEVVGTASHISSTNAHAFFWNNERGLIDIGFLNGSSQTWTSDINNLSQIVGYSGNQAYFWDEDLGMLALGGTSEGAFSRANSINDYGLIIGNDSYQGAMLWDINEGFGGWSLNGLIDPNDPLFGIALLNESWGINNLGQIVGHGWFGDRAGAYLLTPVNNVVVPEPDSFILFMVSLTLVSIFFCFSRNRWTYFSILKHWRI